MGPFETYDRIVALGAEPAHATRVAAMRRAFEGRTGPFKPEDAWFETRTRAFWDDALTTQGFARDVAPQLPAEARPWVHAMERAHRGLFRVEEESADRRVAIE